MHWNLYILGIPLPDGGAGEECEAVPQATAAKHPDHHGADVARRRWWPFIFYLYVLTSVK